MIIVFGIATTLATMAGGLFALRYRDRFRLILGFSAGAVLGVVFFDLFPEAILLGNKDYKIGTITAVIALGFLLYMILDRLTFLPSFIKNGGSHLAKRGALGAGSLSIHSLLDGVAIGLAYQVSPSIGLIIAIGVLVHDFSDGINTVSIVLKNNGTNKLAFKWLLADAFTPLLGVVSTLFFKIPETSFGLLLGLFAGAFFYIGASDLLPESQNRFPTIWTALMTILGMALLYIAICLAS